MRGSGIRVTHHEHVRRHGFQVAQGIQQGLALAGGRFGDIQIEHVRAETLGRQLEGTAGAGTGFEEQVHHRLAAQQRHLLDRPATHIHKAGGGVENVFQKGTGEVLSSEKVTELAVVSQLYAGGGRKHQRSDPVVVSFPSTSSRISATSGEGPRNSTR